MSTTALAGGKAYFLERAPGADQFNLKDGANTQILIDTTGIIRSTGVPHAIDWISPSPDGSKIAVMTALGRKPT